MAWGFRKSKKLFPGVRVSVSKRGASFSGGPKGAKVSVNTPGERRASAGLFAPDSPHAQGVDPAGPRVRTSSVDRLCGRLKKGGAIGRP